MNSGFDMEETEFRGHWWVPGHREERVGGIARYTPEDGIWLELFSALDQSPGNLGTGSIVQFDRLLGVSTEGEAITLFGCTRDSTSRKQNQEANETVSTHLVNYLVEGAFLPSHNLAFDSISVSFPLLEEWAWLTSPQPNLNMRNPPMAQAGDVYQVTFQLPTVPEARVDDLTIKLRTNGSTNTKLFRSGSIDQTAFLDVIPRRTLVPLNEYHDYLNKLRNFTSFGVGRPVQPRYVRGTTRNSRGEEVSTEIYYSLGSTFEEYDFVHPHSMLFNLQLINFEEAIGGWFKMMDSYGPVFDLYFGAQFNPMMYPQNTFLSLSQAFESLHRRTRKGRYHSGYKYDFLLEDMSSFLDGDLGQVYDNSSSLKNPNALGNPGAVLNNLDETYNVDSDFVNKMKHGTLKYANGYSLRKRLSELVDEYRPILNDLPHNITRKQNRVINTRNFLTHYDESISDVARGDDIQELIWGLQQLIEVHLLTELGIADSIIESRIEYRYRHKQMV